MGAAKRRSIDSTIGEELYGAGTDVDAGIDELPGPTVFILFFGINRDVEMLGFVTVSDG